MARKVDFLVVGSGLAGATVARKLVDSGKEVIVIEKRNHLGGNVFDKRVNGQMMGVYGPHYFRTSSQEIWDWVNQFSTFREFKARVRAVTPDDRNVAWPLNEEFIAELAEDDNWRESLYRRDGRCLDFEDACLSMMPKIVYDRYVKEYNEKQWGCRPEMIDASLMRRFDVRPIDDKGYLKPSMTYQGIPEGGYTEWMCRMLDGITVLLGQEYQKSSWSAKHIVWTGPIDMYFDYVFGSLLYRKQKRTTFNAPAMWDHEQVNFPMHASGPQIRSIQWGKIYGEPNNLYTFETPDYSYDVDTHEYPVPLHSARIQYEQYRQLAVQEKDVTFVGRLAEYRYYDMDQIIARALKVGERLCS